MTRRQGRLLLAAISFVFWSIVFGLLVRWVSVYAPNLTEAR